MVVDDSVVIRRIVTRVLEQDPAIEVVGSASNGLHGLQRIPQLNPDVLTLDIEMPDMDGLEMLRRVRQEYPALRVIMFSTLTERGAAITLEALTLGAEDYVTKSSNEASREDSFSRLKDEMIPKIRQFFRFPRQSEEAKSEPAHPTRIGPPVSYVATSTERPRVVAVGISTGGPTALGSILPALPASFPLPILIVQHMPPLFTRLLAERLNSRCALDVREAVDGDVVEPGKILLAPGDFHMKVNSNQGKVSVVLDQSSQQNFCRPAVDVLFRSVGEVYGGATLAVVLTGMGQDGLRGVEVLKARGARILAQDEATSVIWGMPGAVVRAGLADQVLPLEAVIPEIVRMAGRN
ncbi:MAG: chemotaxis response regulator protein-glutamate methylesterase [Terracidiphilus sp.]